MVPVFSVYKGTLKNHIHLIHCDEFNSTNDREYLHGKINQKNNFIFG